MDNQIVIIIISFCCILLSGLVGVGIYFMQTSSTPKKTPTSSAPAPAPAPPPAPAPAPAPAKTYNKIANGDWPGNDIKYFTGPFDKCAEECNKTDNCVGYITNKPKGSDCWLKSGFSNKGGSNPDRDTFYSNSLDTNLNPFTIQWKDKNKCLAVQAGKNEKGTNISLWETCSKTDPNQQFRYTEDEQIKWNDKCLNLSGGSTDNGTEIKLWDCDGNNIDNKFTFKDNQIRSKKKMEQCFNMRGGSEANFTPAILWPCNQDDPNDKFVLL